MAEQEDVRRIVREEMSRISRQESQPPNIFARTQDLIRNAARSQYSPAQQQGAGPSGIQGSTRPTVSPHHGRPTPPVVPPTPEAVMQPRQSTLRFPSEPQQPAWSGKRKAQTGHPWRLKAAKSKNLATKKVKPDKSVYVWLLDCPDEVGHVGEYYFSDSMIVLKGYVSLNPNESSFEIKAKITELFQTKFPNVTADDFQYVKRERGTVSVPVTQIDFEWDFQSLKSLWGQGKLYCRIRKSSRKGLGLETESEVESDIDMQVGNDNNSPDVAFIDNNVDLEDIPESLPGPSTQRSETESAPQEESDLLSLVNELLDKQDGNHLIFLSLESALQHLQSKLNNEKIRLRVQQSYALEEALGHYKSSDFDPSAKLTIQYRGQSAIDTGGVLRQFYTDVFDQMIDGGEDVPPLFEGSDHKKVPTHNASTVLSGVFELVGKIIVHALVLANVGICCLSPASYRYLVTGDLSATIDFVTVEDVANPVIKEYIEKVFQSNATEADLSSIYYEEEFQNLVSDSGVSQRLMLANRNKVMQYIILHDVIGKRVAALEQIRKGLQMLGFLDVMMKNPAIFESFFVYKETDLSADLLLEKLRFDVFQDEVPKVKGFLLRYIEEACQDDLERLLVFVTGCKSLPSKKIDVKVCDETGFFASTCMLQLKIPSGFENFSDFKDGLNVMIRNTGKAFTSV